MPAVIQGCKRLVVLVAGAASANGRILIWTVCLSMVSAIEEHFNVHIPNEQRWGFKTLNSITGWLEEHQGHQPTSI